MPRGQGFGGQLEVSGLFPAAEELTPSDSLDEWEAGTMADLAPIICETLVVGVRQRFVSAHIAREWIPRNDPITRSGKNLKKPF
jgi:hypothetical protein